MLHLVGVGLAKGDMPIGSIQVCRGSEVYYDNYTSYIPEDYLQELSVMFEKKIKPMDRHSMEEDISFMLEKAKSKSVAILIGGDPLMATTHKIIFIEAKKAKVDVKIHHAASILSELIGESGLDFYRFGQVCTISRWSEKYKPVSFYETVQKNAKNNAHTILLLDYDPAAGSSLDMGTAIKILRAAEAQYSGGIISNNSKIFVMHRLSQGGEQKRYLKISDAERLDLKSGPTAIIIPAKLSDIEREIIETIYKD